MGKRSKEEQTNVVNDVHSGQPSTATYVEIKELIDQHIWTN
jgi:hypothetical protein